jgi:hypothetical protein
MLTLKSPPSAAEEPADAADADAASAAEEELMKVYTSTHTDA